MLPSVCPGIDSTRAPPPNAIRSPSLSARSTRHGGAGGSWGRTTIASYSGFSSSVSTGGGPGTSPRMIGASAAPASTSTSPHAARSAAEPVWSLWKWVSTTRRNADRSKPSSPIAAAISDDAPGSPVSTNVSSPESFQRYTWPN
ncbi:hypothetical protein GCM10027569_81050 [Flindersiella endophytica]